MTRLRIILLSLYIIFSQNIIAGELEYDSFEHFLAKNNSLKSLIILFQKTDINEDGYQDVLATFNDGLNMSLIILQGNNRGRLSMCCTAMAETGLRTEVRTIRKYAKNAFFLTFYLRPDELNNQEAQYSFRFAIIGDKWRLIGEDYENYPGETRQTLDKRTTSVNFVTGKKVNRTINYKGETLISEELGQYQAVLMKDFYFNKPESMKSQEKSYGKRLWWLEKYPALSDY
jgi:hypothetical protein